MARIRTVDSLQMKDRELVKALVVAARCVGEAELGEGDVDGTQLEALESEMLDRLSRRRLPGPLYVVHREFNNDEQDVLTRLANGEDYETIEVAVLVDAGLVEGEPSERTLTNKGRGLLTLIADKVTRWEMKKDGPTP